MKSKHKMIMIGVLFIAIAFLSGCAANNTMYLEKPAGFWAGLWHGFIIVISFIISLFTDSVTVYEFNNTGNWYNFGFVLGAMIALGGQGKMCCKKKPKSDKEKEWEEIGVKVEEKVRTGIKKWVDENDEEKSEWEEIGKKVEEKIKRELRNWADKE